MLTAGAHPSNGWLACWFALFAFFAELCLIPSTLNAQQPEILPLSQVKPGMQGYAYTIFTGDKIEKFDLEVLGVLANFLGPKQSIILVQLKGPKVEHTGVVAGELAIKINRTAAHAGTDAGVFDFWPLKLNTPASLPA